MTDHKRDATFHPGQASVSWPDTLAAHGYRAEAVPPPDDEIPWESPGRPPWVKPEKSRGLPAWAWVSIVLGSLALCLGGSVALSLLDESGPVPAVRTSTAAVTTSGTCEKKIIGEYGLVATVTAVNATDKPQAGSIWIEWKITGETAQRFVKPTTLAPGEAMEFPVNHEVPAERWYRTGACSFGWAPQG